MAIPKDHPTSTTLEEGEKDRQSSLHVEIDLEAEKKLVRKLDFHIVPMVMLLYLFSFLDRVNIGNARLYGMEKDLNLKANQYQIAVSILFVTYVLFEVPSNLVLKRFTPSRYIAAITTAWGIVATLTGVVQSYSGLIVCRLLLGALEAGLFPGMTIYLTFFYTKRELALRVGYLFVSSALAGAFGGLLAYAIGHLDGVAGQRGWRWILILEGVPTVFLGILTWFVLADDPEHAYYLSSSEKAMMIARRDREAGQTASAQQLHRKDALKAPMDWKVLAFCIGQFGVDTMLYGYSTFLPTIIQGMGRWSNTQVQALTVPCYALGAISYLVVARISDTQQRRGLYTVLFGAIAVVGYGLLISSAPSGVHYLGCFVVALGLYVAVGLPLAWLPSNTPRYGKKTVATGLQLSFGNCSGIMAPFLYRTNEGPRYIRGHAVTLAMVGFASIIYAFMSWYLGRINTRRSGGGEDWKVEGRAEVDIAELGDESPRFIFTT